MKLIITASALLIMLSCHTILFAQKTRTEMVTEWDKKAKKEITFKEEVQKLNASGDAIETFGYDKKGVQNKYIKTEFNTAGKKLKEEHYNEKGQLKKILLYKYDAKGLKTDEITYAADGKTIIEKHKFTYE